MVYRHQARRHRHPHRGATFPVLIQPSAASLCALARKATKVIGIATLAGLVDIVREKDYDNSDNFFLLGRRDRRSRRPHRREPFSILPAPIRGRVASPAFPRI